MFMACSKTKAQIKCSFKYNGFSAGCICRSFRVWEDTVLTPLPLLLMRNNRGRHYLTISSHSGLKKNRMAKEKMERESFPGCPASIQLLQTKLHWNILYCLEISCKLEVWIWGDVCGFYFVLAVCFVEQFAVNLSSTLCNTKAGIF